MVQQCPPEPQRMGGPATHPPAAGGMVGHRRVSFVSFVFSVFFCVLVSCCVSAGPPQNQELPNVVAQRAWIQPQKDYVAEAERPDCNGIRWECKYLTRGCSCGWPYYLTRIPQLTVERRRCANYCCKREWEVHSTV